MFAYSPVRRSLVQALPPGADCRICRGLPKSACNYAALLEEDACDAEPRGSYGLWFTLNQIMALEGRMEGESTRATAQCMGMSDSRVRTLVSESLEKLRRAEAYQEAGDWQRSRREQEGIAEIEEG